MKNEFQNIIDEFKLEISQLENELHKLDDVLLGQGFIVRMEGLCIKFDVDASGNVTNPCHAKSYRATRFELSDAKRIAASVQNGNGVAGEAIHVKQAIQEQIEQMRNVCAALEKLEK